MAPRRHPRDTTSKGAGPALSVQTQLTEGISSHSLLHKGHWRDNHSPRMGCWNAGWTGKFTCALLPSFNSTASQIRGLQAKNLCSTELPQAILGGLFRERGGRNESKPKLPRLSQSSFPGILLGFSLRFHLKKKVLPPKTSLKTAHKSIISSEEFRQPCCTEEEVFQNVCKEF